MRFSNTKRSTATSWRRLSVTAAVIAGVVVAGSGCAAGDDGGDDGGGSGGSAGSVTIGFIAPLKGSNAATAEAMVNAATIAVDEANENGGVDGRTVELKVYDDELSADIAARVATRAITVDNVSVLVGGLSSAEGLAIREVAERSEVPYLAAASSAMGITQDAEFTFRVAATAVDQANSVVDIANALGAKKAAILYDNGAVGPALAEMFTARAAETGLALSGPGVEFTLAGTDISGPVQTVAAQSPDIVLVGGSTGADHGLLAKTMVEQGVQLPIVGLVGIGFPDAHDVAAGAYDQIPGAYFTSSVDLDKPRFKEFQDVYFERFGEAVLPDAAVQSYDATRVAIQALQATSGEGGTALRDAITALDPLEGAAGREGSMISFQEGHDGFAGGFLVVYRATGGANVIARDVVLD
ncbi:ABC transporter substrate-binding protein [Microbacterium sp. No. 7]|uniref:ABC transporter substrate-binding protein n=1 Tax=Microbacterium sp. No. 7 TaxID=1714373 RepID=UPI0006CFF855|nr:ABC transporter substrate-binding protein [Microbacterium sp. No. 7]ALJ21862.1 hypothetical protein AOA12_18955 [Microbacterium sp. No. 7]